MRYYSLMALLWMLCACDPQRVFEENLEIEADYWYVDSLKTFTFQVPDSSMKYDVLANITQYSNYPYYNLYYRFYLKDSAGEELISELANIDLFDPKTGEPLGDGLGDIFDNQQKILTAYQFPYSGDYTLSLQQYMRTDSLSGVKSVGARLEYTP